MPIRSFRGKISDYDATIPGSGIDTITLHTNDGSIGYRIKKVQCVPENPGTTNTEHVFKIYKIPQTTATGSIDFSDQTLLASVYLSSRDDRYGGDNIIVFDNEIFNQDIYLTHNDTNNQGAVNYYIELEQVKLDLSENTVATLKDIRNIERDSTVTIP
tara:strand:- start:45 stop:518 length:474 start_codon:yes stop_codon:yes gene_type:complete